MKKTLLNKLLTLYVLLRHGRVDYNLRFFYRDTYHCRLVQLKYFLKDYLFKPKYKEISFDGEFAPELQFVLAFAYWDYKNGTLKSTKSSKFTSEFYFFTPEHKEEFSTRTNEGNYNFETPRILYSHDYNMKKWLPVPLKENYRNDVYVFDKPILIVANRYNMEWDGPPVSFFSIDTLAYIFNKLQSTYQIIYNRPRPQNITMDNSDIYDLNEYDWIRENYPDIILMEDLYQENKANAKTFNHLQLMVYANSENFISTHGGTAALASYFKGVNLILSKKGPEHYFKCYEKLYPKLSGTHIIHAKTDLELKQNIEHLFLTEKKGLVNATS